jgi:hypothetical protein
LEIQPPACAERIGYQAEGDLPRASAILGPLHPVADNTAAPEAQVYQAILEQRTGQIISRLKEILARPDPTMGYLIRASKNSSSHLRSERTMKLNPAPI